MTNKTLKSSCLLALPRGGGRGGGLVGTQMGKGVGVA